MVIAVAWFRDCLAPREWMGALVIVGGAAVVSYRPGAINADWVGVLAVVGACLCWGLDNNVLQRVSSYDPVSVVQIKALSAGVVSVLLALTLGQRPTGGSVIPAALSLGFLCYGISVVDMYALRYLVGFELPFGFSMCFTTPFSKTLGYPLGARPFVSRTTSRGLGA